MFIDLSDGSDIPVWTMWHVGDSNITNNMTAVYGDVYNFRLTINEILKSIKFAIEWYIESLSSNDHHEMLIRPRVMHFYSEYFQTFQK